MSPFYPPSAFIRFLGPDGEILPFGKLYFYLTGTLTEEPVYDANGDELAQPVLADITGAWPQIYLNTEAIYRVRLENAAGVEIADVDPYPAFDASDILFIQSGIGAVTRTALDKMRDIVSPTDYGVTFDGVTDDTAAWSILFAAADGRTIRCPAGTSLCLGYPAVPSNTRIEGAGRDATTIHFKNLGAGNYGFTMGYPTGVSNITFTDLTLKCEDNQTAGTGKFCDSITYNGPCENISFERVTFIGAGTHRNCETGRIVYASNSDLFNVRYIDCRFERLVTCLFKSSPDTSEQSNFLFLGCTFYNCYNGLDINSPNGFWSSVSVIGCDFDTMLQFPIAFAGAACSRSFVSGCRFTRCRLEAVHYEDDTHDHTLSGNSFVECNQMAGVSDGAAGINPGSLNGAVQIIDGAYDIRVVDNTFDLTKVPASDFTGTTDGTTTITAISINTNLLAVGCPIKGVNIPAGATIASIVSSSSITISGAATGSTVGGRLWAATANGVCIQAAGGAEVNSIAIRGNRFSSKYGTISVIALVAGSDGPIEVSNNELINVSSTNKADYFIEGSQAHFAGGGNKLVNPSAFISDDNASFGGLRASHLSGDLSTFEWQTGNTGTSTGIQFVNWTVDTSFEATTGPTLTNLIDAGSMLMGTMSLHYTGGSAADSGNKVSPISWVNGSGTVTEGTIINDNGADIDMNPGGTMYDVSAGKLRTVVKRASGDQTGTLVAEFTGVLFG